MKKALTKDEIFLVKLREFAIAKGDQYAAVDRFEIGRAMGQNDKGIDIIVRDLIQTYFVKKGDGNTLSLTDKGFRLLEELSSS